MAKSSRAKIASYFAEEIVAGNPDVVERLAALLVQTHRTAELDLIVADIEVGLAERGIIIADVSTALPVDEGFEEAIRQLLAAGKNDRVMLREHVDQNLIGGIKISAAGRELDATVRHRLKSLKNSYAA